MGCPSSHGLYTGKIGNQIHLVYTRTQRPNPYALLPHTDFSTLELLISEVTIYVLIIILKESENKELILTNEYTLNMSYEILEFTQEYLAVQPLFHKD